MKNILIAFFAFNISTALYAQDDSVVLVQRISKLEQRFEQVLSNPKKHSFKQQDELLTESFETLDKSVRYAVKRDEIDSRLMEALCKLAFLNGVNDRTLFTRTRIHDLYKKHPEAFKQAAARMLPEQSQYLFHQLSLLKGRKVGSVKKPTKLSK